MRLSQNKCLTAIGCGIYVAVLLLWLALLIIEPNNFDFKLFMIPVIIGLFISSLLIGAGLIGKNDSRLISIFGAVAVSILFTLLGILLVLAMVWLMGFRHV